MNYVLVRCKIIVPKTWNKINLGNDISTIWYYNSFFKSMTRHKIVLNMNPIIVVFFWSKCLWKPFYIGHNISLGVFFVHAELINYFDLCDVQQDSKLLTLF